MACPNPITPPGSGTLVAFREGIPRDLLTLALLHDRELDRSRVLALWEVGYSDLLALRLVSEAGRKGLSLFRQGLTEIPARVDQASLDALAVDFADIYLNNRLGASPFESVWLDKDHLAMQEPMFQIRSLYRRHGLAVSDWRQRSDDHLVHQLQFLAFLLDEDPEGSGLQLAARFLDEHTLRWIGDFARRVSEGCDTRFYAGLALLTAAYLEELRDILSVLTSEPRPTPEQVEERTVSTSAAPKDPPAAYLPGSTPSW
jgi:TorA maturation chaperone TorD